jgi:hypothetical protein
MMPSLAPSTQRDTERALIAKEKGELDAMPEAEHAELVELLRRRGLSDDTSMVVAAELTERDALTAHLGVELGIDQEELANPWAAAGSSALAFSVGAVVPLVAVLVPPASVRIAPCTHPMQRAGSDFLARSAADCVGKLKRFFHHVHQWRVGAAPRWFDDAPGDRFDRHRREGRLDRRRPGAGIRGVRACG